MTTVEYHTHWRNYKNRVTPRFIEEGNYYNARVSGIEPVIYKCFPVSDYKSKEDCFNAAFEWTREEEEKYGVARNMVKYLNKDTIEVQANCEGVPDRFITDACKLDLVKKRLWRIQQKNGHRYVVSSDGSTIIRFHKEAINNAFNVIVFRNGIGTDNRACNLRDGAKGVAQWNKRPRSNNTSGIPGVRWMEDRMAFEYTWRENKKPRHAYFSIHKYGTVDNAKIALEERIKEIDLYLGRDVIEKTNEGFEIGYKDIIRECKSKRKIEELDETQT